MIIIARTGLRRASVSVFVIIVLIHIPYPLFKN